MWFRQDLRLSDNSALCAAAAAGPLICLHILDDDTPGPWRWGGASRWWLHHSLTSLGARIRLVLRRGPAHEAIADVLAATSARAVYFSRDYSPWSAQQEDAVRAVCASAGASCNRYSGFLLHEPEELKTASGGPYKVFSPFARACLGAGDPRRPRPVPRIEFWKGEIGSDSLADWNLLPTRPNWASRFAESWTPGEAGAQQRLSDFLDNGLAGYADGRDRPDLNFTSRLSPHLHWGEISPVQVWSAARTAVGSGIRGMERDGEKFLKELLWREFSYHLLLHFPDMVRGPFRAEFQSFPWREDRDGLLAWQRGLTGYPLVDAGMRELWATGGMHNRVRMVAASFLTKHLLLHWQEGMAWFWDTLVDADIGNNTASWQWVTGCGADAAPYFRIFNPVLQGEKFDPKGQYVRRWLPELKNLPDPVIHRPWTASQGELADAGLRLGTNYPMPIIEHASARLRALAAFKSLHGADAPSDLPVGR